MRKIAFVVALVVLLAAVGAVAFQWFRPPELSGTILQSPERATDFTLTAAGGKQVKLSDFRGKWTLLYFGYTFCPDVCPTTLADLNDAQIRLGSQADKMQVIMISVDPERDSPERLAEYVGFFNPAFLGLTGSKEAIDAAATQFGVFYEKVYTEGATTYLVNHTSSVMVIDPDGYLRYLIPYGAGGQAIANDLRYLMRRG